MAGRALGGHIWDSMEEALGGPGSFRQSVVTDAWADTHKGWQGHDVRADAEDDDYPVAHIKGTGQWSGKYPIGGPYLTVHRGGEPVEALHMDKEDRHPDAVNQRLHNWIAESSHDYE